MKKLIVLAAAALLAAGANAAYKDGSYTGEGQGKSGPVKVQVTVKAGKIASVKVLEQKETPMIWKGAEAGVIPAIVHAVLQGHHRRYERCSRQGQVICSSFRKIDSLS